MGCIDVDTVRGPIGVPARITTDRRTQFTSGTWGEWCKNVKKQGVKSQEYWRQRRPYNSGWWYLDSCRRPVSSQQEWRSLLHALAVILPRRRLLRVHWMGRTGGGIENDRIQNITHPYSGPYRVLKRGNKGWKVHVCDRVEILGRYRLSLTWTASTLRLRSRHDVECRGRSLWFLWHQLLGPCSGSQI